MFKNLTFGTLGFCEGSGRVDFGAHVLMFSKDFFRGGRFPFRISLTFIKFDKLEGLKCSKF